MPTRPLETLLYRELSQVEAKSIIDIASPLLQEFVNYGTHALVRCADSLIGEENEDLAVLALYRHLIEMIDGVEVLISQSCSAPAAPLLRSSFEALLYIEYILEDDAEYVRRSLSWLAGHAHRRLGIYRSLDRSTTAGKRFQEALKQDKTVQEFTFPPQDQVQRAQKVLENLLSREQFREVEAEYSRPKRRPQWFQLFGGPANRRELANRVGWNAQYHILYNIWSASVHAEDFSRFITRTSEGEAALPRMRDPREVKETAMFAATFILSGTRLVLSKFRPGENTDSWFLREIRPRYRMLYRR